MMAARNLSALSRQEFKQFFNSFDTVLTDCDGVLWLHTAIIKGSNDVINWLKQSGKSIFYVTNNSTKSRQELLSKIVDMGFNGTENEVVATSYLITRYLKDLDFKKKVYVIGSAGITKEMDMANISHTGIGPDVMTLSFQSFCSTELKLESDVGAVVVGFDEHISYPKITKAANYLANKDCLFLATNTDEQFPIASSTVLPGTGCALKAIEACAQRKAHVVGKPHSYTGDYLIKTFKIDPKRTIMIGDRSNSDILLGKRCNFQTLLVLSGITTLEEINKWKTSSKPEELDLVPDFYIDKLGDMMNMLKNL